MGQRLEWLQLMFTPIALNKHVAKGQQIPLWENSSRQDVSHKCAFFQHTADCINKPVLKVIKSTHETERGEPCSTF